MRSRWRRSGRGTLDQRDAWEVGALDLELPKLLLDVEAEARAGSERALLAEWAKIPARGSPSIPAFGAGRVGKDIPASHLAAVTRRVKEEGLRFADGGSKNAPSGRARATGVRFAPGEARQGRKRRFAMRSPSAAVTSSSGARTGGSWPRQDHACSILIAASSGRFDRSRRTSRAITSADAAPPAQVCATSPPSTRASCSRIRVLPPLDERFLTPEAAAVTRATRRNVMIPFFRRMEKEGLWDRRHPSRR
jgi:hypothetical protein